MRTLRFFSILIVFFIFFAYSVPSCLAAEKSIRFGYYSGFNIFGESKKNNIKALGQDSLLELAKQAKIKIQLIDLKVPFTEALEKNLVDVVGLSVPIPQLEDKVTFSKNVYGFAQFGLATKHLHNVFYDDPKSINRKKVATFHGNNANPLFQAYLTKNNISVEYVYGDLNSYTNLKADFYLIFSSIKNINDFEIVLNLGKSPLHLVTKKGNESAMLALDNAYSFLLNKKMSQINRIQEVYKKIDEKFSNRSLTRNEANLLMDKTFTVGFIQNNPPYQYVDEKGNAQGISVEILNDLAKRYKFTIKYVPYEIKDDKSLPDFNNIDILISLKGDKENINQYFQATDPFHHIQMIMLIAKSGKENVDKLLQNKSYVGMLPNINFDYGQLSRTIPKAKLFHYSNFDELLNAFKNNDIDGAIFTSTDAAYAHVLTKNTGHLYPLNIELPISFYISHTLGDTYLKIFNVMLANISYQYLYEINFKHTTNFSPIYSLKNFLLENWIYILMFVGFFIFVFTTLLMRTQINKKNEFLQLLYSDEITSLISLRYFRLKVQEVLNIAKPSEYELITLDIDYFRMVNKHYGMEAGTQVIRDMGTCLAKAYQDTGAIISRKHSEQFVIFKKVNVGDDIEYVVGTLLQNTIKDIVGKNFSLTMSVGIFPIVNPQEELSDMIDFADIARKRGKAYHKFSYITFNEKMRHNFYETLNIVYRMESALRDEEFKVVFQPKICFETLKIIGAEALVRWIPLDGEPIYPDKFISTMETDGFISELDLYIFEKVCKFIYDNANNYNIPQLAVNLSAVTMCEVNIVEKLILLTKKYNILPSQIEIELTESALNTFEDTVIFSLYKLKEYGFSIAMDDFGTGESSLNRLSVSNVDVLKLDKSFLEFNHDSERGKIVVKKIIDLAKDLNMKIVSEGVETLEQVLWLKKLECHIAQGYYFSPPMDAEAFKKLLKEDITYALE